MPALLVKLLVPLVSDVTVKLAKAIYSEYQRKKLLAKTQQLEALLKKKESVEQARQLEQEIAQIVKDVESSVHVETSGNVKVIKFSKD